MKKIIFILYTFLGIGLFGQENSNLELNIPTGNLGGISTICFSSNEKIFFSGGNGGLIIAWDIYSGRKLYTLDGDGSGIINLSLSPNNQFLAASTNNGKILIWNIINLELLFDEEYDNWTFDLFFSSDNNYLIGRSGPNYVYVWDLRTKKLKHELNHPSVQYVSVHDTNTNTIISTGDKEDLRGIKINRNIRIWNLDTGLLEDFDHINMDLSFLEKSTCGFYYALSGDWGIHLLNDNFKSKKKQSPKYTSNGKVIITQDCKNIISIWEGCVLFWNVDNSENTDPVLCHNNSISDFYISKDNKRLYTCSQDRTIKIWNLKTKELIRTISGKSAPISSIKLSTDNKRLSFGSFDGSIKVWDLEKNNMEYFGKHDNSILSIESIDTEKLLISSSYDMSSILWDFRTGLQRHKFEGHSKGVISNAVSKDNKFLVTGSGDLTYDFENEQSEIIIWDLAKRKKWKEIKNNTGIRAIDASIDNYLIYGDLNGQICKYDLIKKKKETCINAYDYPVNSIVCNKDGTLVYSASSNGKIKILDENLNLLDSINLNKRISSFLVDEESQLCFFGIDNYDEINNIGVLNINSGELLMELAGHKRTVYDISLSANKKKLFSCSGDNSIKIWDVKKGITLATFFPLNQHDWICTTPFDNFEQEKIDPNQIKSNYFFGTINASKLLSYSKGTKNYKFEQFDLKYNRPDIVLSRLGYAQQSLIDSYYKAYQKRLEKMNFTEQMLSDEFHVPEIEVKDIYDIPISTTDKTLSFDINASDSKQKLDRINIWVNDVPIYGVNGISLRNQNISEYTSSISLELSNGNNKIQVSTLNQGGAESLKETFEINYEGETEKTNLYVLALGVSKYLEEEKNLKYAAKDASDIMDFFKQSNNTFSEVKSLLFTNQDVTKSSIQEAKKILQKTNVDDQVILYVSGHGLLDDSLDFYFATHDVDFNNPKDKGILYDDIENLLDSIPARQKLLLMDACYSGEVDKDNFNTEVEIASLDLPKGVRHRGFVPKLDKKGEPIQKPKVGLENSFELMKQLYADLRRGSGATIISSASGDEFSFEDDKFKNGLFTYAFIQGIQSGEADKQYGNGDEITTVSEIKDYVRETVSKLTKDKQTPTSRRENLEFDFRIW